MTSNDFFSTKSLEQQITNRKKDVKKQTVSWLSMIEIVVQREKPGVLLFKYTHDKEVPYYELNIRKKLTGMAPTRNFAGQALDHLYPQGHVIAENKLNVIRNLLKYVPEDYHDFYLKIKPSETAEQAEDSDGVILEELVEVQDE